MTRRLVRVPTRRRTCIDDALDVAHLESGRAHREFARRPNHRTLRRSIPRARTSDRRCRGYDSVDGEAHDLLVGRSMSLTIRTRARDRQACGRSCPARRTMSRRPGARSSSQRSLLGQRDRERPRSRPDPLLWQGRRRRFAVEHRTRRARRARGVPRENRSSVPQPRRPLRPW